MTRLIKFRTSSFQIIKKRISKNFATIHFVSSYYSLATNVSIKWEQSFKSYSVRIRHNKRISKRQTFGKVNALKVRPISFYNTYTYHTVKTLKKKTRTLDERKTHPPINETLHIAYLKVTRRS